MGSNIKWHDGLVTHEQRSLLIKQKSLVLWFTGLSGSGKSTIACGLEKFLFDKGFLSYRLDGDNIRYGLNANLGFSEEDRTENIRRISETSKLFADAGVITLVSFISPLKEMRNMAKEIIGDNFYEVYCRCSVDDCIKRDPKGLYKKALNGEIKNFTGIDALYEEPENPFIQIDTASHNINESVLFLYEKIKHLISKSLAKIKTEI